jgi:hypothetical protein
MTDTLTEKIDTTRIRDSQDAANIEANHAKLNERQRLQRRREANRVAWIEFYTAMAESHRQLSEEHAQRAADLLTRTAQ